MQHIIRILVNMLAMALTQTLLKHAIIAGLKNLAKKTDNKFDDELTEVIAKFWSINENTNSSHTDGMPDGK